MKKKHLDQEQFNYQRMFSGPYISECNYQINYTKILLKAIQQMKKLKK